MGELSEFQKRRLENIKRNNDLLKKLNLNGVSKQLKSEVGVDDKPKARNRGSKKRVVKREPKPVKVPTRRSRRLMGESSDGKEVPHVNDHELLKNTTSESKLEELKNTAVVGDVKLSDLLKSEDESELLARFQSYNNKTFSSGDFFQEIQKHKKVSRDVAQLQKELDLQLYEIFEPNEVKIVHDRISAMFFHPSIDRKLVIGGDTTGHVGLWNVHLEKPADEVESPDITTVKLFNKNVAKIDVFPQDTSKLATASYDGLLRSIDLTTFQSDEMLTMKDEYDDYMGISDFQFSFEDPNQIFLTTLGGEFAAFDLRTKPTSTNIRRLADKKIGSFSINPQRPYEIATGSLDRTLKLWDVRKVVKSPSWLQNEDYPSHELVSTYDSRLSVSAVSYSPLDGSLVCNGYDDTIRIFDVKEVPPAELQPKLTLKHNCQSGRWTSILKTRFKANMDVFAIANMSRAIDIYHSSGDQLAHLKTATVPAVLSWHPLQNWIVGGNSSGKVFLFEDRRQQ
ncbi:LANO_0E01552g1_1 [Lachancea nothofagi CBS 11611]|uniref:DNA damage-binding protein CMR1 n=1 Tax=Lachancea nothofagi CBS 11611 TaxID=1266666 RepID=A0A1G4JPG2_9SACH|nr:LANO_0E01552g1_1 [Lachancea nothofagi CBS 11611]